MIKIYTIFLGEGWLFVTFYKMRISQGICDSNSECDGYVKLIVDDRLVCETSVKRDFDKHSIMHECPAQKIRQNSMVRVEIWDSDDWFNGGDDLISSFTEQVFKARASNQVKWEYDDKRVVINYATMWKPEYV